MELWINSILLKKELAASPSKKHSTLENIKLLLVASWNNDGVTQIFGCKCSFEITTCLKQKYLPNTLYHIHAIHGSKCSFKKYSIHWKMGGHNYFREIKKYYTLKKILSAVEQSNLQRIFFRNHYNYFIASFYQLLFHYDFCTSVSNCSSRNTRPSNM